MPDHHFKDKVLSQLARVEPIADRGGPRVHRQCVVKLRDGRELDRVLLTDCRILGRKPRIGDFGFALWPSDVIAVEPSPYAMPAALAPRVFEFGETYMGVTVIGLTLRDGRRYQWWTDGGACPAFPPLPPQTKGQDIVDVRKLSHLELQAWDAIDPPRVWVVEHL